MEDKFVKLDELRAMKIMNNGKILVIKSLSHSMIVPLFCPICEFPMKTSDDSLAYKTFSCCDLCALKFAYTYKEKWENGWRPSEEELKEYKEEREIRAKQLLILR